jgi:anti-anti-sigma factor
VNGLVVVARSLDGVAVAELTGEIDVLNGDELVRDLMRAGLTSSVGLVADLNGVRYADSAGIRTLFALVRDLERARLGFAVAINELSPLRRLLKVTNFDEVVPTTSTVEDAVAALRGDL